MNVKVFASAALVAVIATTQVAYAQSSYKMGFTFGSNYSSLRSDLYTTASGRLGAAAGFSIALGFGPAFELNTEIAFAQKGATAKTVYFNPENLAETRSYDFHYNTFEAGVFAGYKPVSSLPIRLQAGGFFGTHFHNLDKSNNELYVGDYENIVNATPVYTLNESLAGVDFGPAFGISAGEGRFRVNARYYLGARNLYNNVAFAPEGHRIHSSSMRLTLTYFFKDKSVFED
jgi:hypothetical protein